LFKKEENPINRLVYVVILLVYVERCHIKIKEKAHKPHKMLTRPSSKLNPVKNAKGTEHIFMKLDICIDGCLGIMQVFFYSC
jgi:hypothetical protein